MIMLFTGERKRGAQKDTEDPNSPEGGVMYNAKLFMAEEDFYLHTDKFGTLFCHAKSFHWDRVYT